jgi:hypothetical protein
MQSLLRRFDGISDEDWAAAYAMAVVFVGAIAFWLGDSPALID